MTEDERMEIVRAFFAGRTLSVCLPGPDMIMVGAEFDIGEDLTVTAFRAWPMTVDDLTMTAFQQLAAPVASGEL